MKFLLIILSILFINTLFAQPNEKTALQNSQSNLKNELAALEAEYKKVSSSKEKSLASLRIIQDKIEVRKNMINNINDEIRILDRTLTGTQKDITILNQKLLQLKKDYAKSIVYAYKNKNSYDFVTFVFSASNFNNAYRRVQYLKEYRNYRHRQVEEIKSYKASLQGKLKIYDGQKKEKSDVINNQSLALSDLAGEQSNLDNVVKKISGTQNTLAVAIQQAKKRQQKINSQIIAINKREELERKKILDAERKRQKEAEALAKAEADRLKKEAAKNKTATTKPTTTPKTTTPKVAPTPKVVEQPQYTQAEVNANASFESNKGRMGYPLQNGYIRTRFGVQDLGGVKWNNEGTTFASNAPGNNVTAIFSGTVKSVQVDDDTKTVYISHGRYISVYGNLGSVNVSVGQAITANQIIGKCAASEEDPSEGLLELMLFRDNKIENPEKWLKR
jgi:murein hydrolase activator